MNQRIKCARTFIELVVFLVLGFAGLNNALAANPFVHPLFTSHMVLQQNATDPVWGWVAPGITVTVKVYDQNAALIQTVTAMADASGRWQTAVGPFSLVPGNAAYSVVISTPGQATVTLTDVLIGDVWLCSGQSNMAWTLSGDYNAAADIADSANYPQVRHFTLPNVSSFTGQPSFPGGSWSVAGPSTTGGFSAVGYIMGREIYKENGIPVGIILSAWGGTLINAWSEPGFVAGIPDYTQAAFDQSALQPSPDFVSCLYNAMIYPLAPYRIKAVTWYQGEFDASTPDQYGRMLPGLMGSWRSLFSQPNLPFIIIQLPNANPQEASNWALLREAQAKSVANDTNSRMVVTIDVGGGLLHPLDKPDMGLRAAWAAANLVYGKNIVDQAPVFTGFTVSGTNLTCFFTNIGAGLMTGYKNYTNPITPVQPVPGVPVNEFQLAGLNGVFYAANATIASSNTVVVSSPSVSQPVTVHYAWLTDPPDCNLYSKITDTNGNVVDGLPAGSFRSDSAVYYLKVNNGSGTGYYAYGAHPAITANGNPTGEVFDHWSGDTNLIVNALGASTTVTVSQPYISVLANYRITGAPPGLSAVPQAGQVTLNWNSMSLVHYNVKRSTVSGGPFINVAANLYATNSFTDTNAAEGTTYYYVVSATNWLGEGPNSSAINTVTTGDLVIGRSGWVASASVGSSPGNAIDGNITTRWSTGTGQANGQWFQVDMGSVQSFYQIVLNAGSSSDYPRGYQVNVSNDGVSWGSPVASGTGSSSVTTITFTPQSARYIRITQTGSDSANWSIYEFYVYQTALIPAGVAAVAGNSQAVLSWNTTLGAASYNVKRSVTQGGPYTVVAGIAATNYVDVGLLNDQPYYYVVSAVNGGGASSNSAEMVVVPSGTNALNRIGWVATASVGSSQGNAIDGDITTRWTTGTQQANGQWFQVDMGLTNHFSQLVLDQGSSSGDYPVGYQVVVSNDGITWSGVVASGAGSSGLTTINFAVQTARFVRVIQTGSAGNWWSIHEFNVYGGITAATQNQLGRTGWIAGASSTESGGSPGNAIDYNLATRWSSGAVEATGMWFQVDMGATNTFYQVVLNVTNSPGDYPRNYKVNVSNDGINWGNSIATGSGSSYLTTISFPTNAARFIRVTLTANSGAGWWGIDEFYVYGFSGTAPAAPAGLTAIGSTGQVVLSWNPSSTATGYNVKCAGSSAGPYALVAANLAALAYTNSGLANNAIYYFVVSGENLAGEGPDSTPTSVALKLPLPLNASTLSGGQLQLAWPTNDNGGLFQVFTATNLFPPVTWALLNNTPVLSGAQWVLTLDSMSNKQAYYRLQK